MPFSARALKENIFFDVDIVVKDKNVKFEIWFIVLCTFIDSEYVTLFPNIFFVFFLFDEQFCKSF